MTGSNGAILVDAISRQFDVSKPWLSRIVEREPRLLLKAVENVTFSIARGETFALVGESGSGKTTVARIVVGLLSPTTGTVRIDGIPMSAGEKSGDRQRLRRRIHMIFQDPYASLNPRWRIGRVIAEPIRVFGLLDTDTAIVRRVNELLELVGLHPDDRNRYPHEFSGGQRQRVAIARALASEAEFIVCDEPTSGLDVSVQAQILNLMRDLQDQFDLTYLLISHDLAVVRHMATRIGVMYLGRIVEIGSSEELFRTPRHPYTRMLLDAVPQMSTRDRSHREISGEIPSPIDPPSGCAFHPRCPWAYDRCTYELPVLLDDVACHAVNEDARLSSGFRQADESREPPAT